MRITSVLPAGPLGAVLCLLLCSITDGCSGLLVTAPANLTGGAGERWFPSTVSTWNEASLFPPFASGIINAKVVEAEPPNACKTSGDLLPNGLSNYLEMQGNVALIDRGVCFFEEKVQNAQRAGAVAVIVANNVAGILTMVGSPGSTVAIPSQAVTLTVGSQLHAQATNASNTTLLRVSVYQNETKVAQKAALRTFYDATGGEKWIRRDGLLGPGWSNQSTDPCRDYWYGITCTESGDVQAFFMEDGFNNLIGTMPGDSTFDAFTGLNQWSIEDEPGLVGSVPAFGAATEMTALALSNTGLSGAIPAGLFRAKMQSLTLNDNMLTGEIPSTMNNLVDCTGLDLSNNQLSGAVPNMALLGSQMPNGTAESSVSLGGNLLTHLTGDLPALERINLQNNRLEGEFFSRVNPANVRIKANRNKFNGTLRCNYDSLTNLRSLDLSNNEFDSIETCYAFGTYGALVASNLELLRFSQNPLSLERSLAECDPGSIGLNTSKTCAAQNAKVHRYEILLFGNMVEFSAAGLPFSLTAEYTELSQMKSLDLSGWDLNPHNSTDSLFDFTKGISSAIAQGSTAGSLNTLKLVGCQLNGDVIAWDQLANSDIAYLDISNNNLTGNPRCRSMADTIRFADFSGNPYLTGAVYSRFGEYENLAYLDLSGTSLKATASDPKLPAFVALDYQTTTKDGLLHHTCPALVGKDRAITFKMDGTYNDYYGCQCDERFRRREGTCQDCPENAECPGGSKESVTVVPHSYFPLPSAEDIQMLIRCRNSTLNESPCNPESADIFECAEGFQNRLCSECESGYFVLGFQCYECGSFIEFLSFTLVLVAVCMFVVYVFVSSALNWSRGTFNITVFYIQTSAFVLTTGLPVLRELEFIEIAYGTAFLKLIGIECFFDSVNYFGRFYVVIFSPFVATALALVVFLGFKAYQLWKRLRSNKVNLVDIEAESEDDESSGDEESSDRRKKEQQSISVLEALRLPRDTSGPHVVYKILIRVLVYSFKLMYFPICLKVFSAFHCPEDPFSGNTFMHEAPYVPCDSAQAITMQVFAVFALIIEVIGVFMATALLLVLFSPEPKVQAWVYRISGGRFLPRGWFRHEIGMLYLCYDRKHFWAELYMMGRKILLAAISSSVAFDSPLLPALISFLLLLSLFIHTATQPFGHATDNLMESWSLCVILGSYVTVVLLASGGFEEGVSNAVQAIILTLNIVTLIILLVMLVSNSRNFAKTWLVKLGALSDNTPENSENDTPLQVVSSDQESQRRPLSVESDVAAPSDANQDDIVPPGVVDDRS